MEIRFFNQDMNKKGRINKKKIEMEKNKQGNNINGITLIALVITIIVLIILATVTIKTLIGENRTYTICHTG